MLGIATYLDSRFKDEVGQLQLKLDVKYALVEFIRKEEGIESEDSADSTSSSIAAFTFRFSSHKTEAISYLRICLTILNLVAISTPSEKAEREFHTYLAW